VDKIKVLKFSKESLETSIAGFTQMKPVLQDQCLRVNLDSKGKQDAKELGEHFDTAINAMITVLAYIEDNSVDGKDLRSQPFVDFSKIYN